MKLPLLISSATLQTRPRRKPVPTMAESLPPPTLLAPPTTRGRAKYRMSAVSTASTTIDFASYHAANASPMPSYTPLMKPRQEFVHQPEDFRDLREEMRRNAVSHPQTVGPPPAEMRPARMVMNRPVDDELVRSWSRRRAHEPRAHGPSAW